LNQIIAVPLRSSTHKQLTIIEVYRRLRAVKRMLENKNQALLYDYKINSLDIKTVEPDVFYLAPVQFDKALFLQAVVDNESLFDRSLFIHRDLRSYIEERRYDICKSYSVTAMLFTKYRKQAIVSKHVIVCLGSIYHAPRIFYRDESSKRVVYEKVAEYNDLL
jgi:hypothetical protein